MTNSGGIAAAAWEDTPGADAQNTWIFEWQQRRVGGRVWVWVGWVWVVCECVVAAEEDQETAAAASGSVGLRNDIQQQT